MGRTFLFFCLLISFLVGFVPLVVYYPIVMAMIVVGLALILGLGILWLLADVFAHPGNYQ